MLVVVLGAISLPVSSVSASGLQVINAIDYATPNDGLNDDAGIYTAIANAQSSNVKHLHFSGGSYNLTTITFPSTIKVSIGDGSSLIAGSSDTVTFNGPFSAGLYTVFSGSGTFYFGWGAVEEVYPQWWPSGSGGTNDSVRIQKAIESQPTASGIKVKLVGSFNCTGKINISRSRVNISGEGRYATQITFNPSVSTVLFNFDAGALSDKTVWQCSIGDFAIQGAGTAQKIGIRMVNTSITNVHDIAMRDFTGGGSIGIQTQGREMGHIENIEISADLPISIEANPYLWWISIDHFTFRNTYLLVNDINGPAVKIATGLYLTNVVFDGTNAWAGGRYGIYWKDTTSTAVSANLSIKNIRMEGAGSPGGHIIHINHNYQLHNLVIENVYGCAGGPGGFYLRKCRSVTLQNLFYTSSYSPTPRPLDMNETCANVTLINCYWNVGAVSTGSLVKTFGAHTSIGGGNVSVIETWDSPASNQTPGIIIYGVKKWCYKGRIASGGSVPLVVGNGKTATVIVSATDGGSIIEGGHFVVGVASGYATKLVVGTSNVAATNTGGKLCLLPGSVLLQNNMSAALDVEVSVSFD
jgi:hypothetical protein